MSETTQSTAEAGGVDDARPGSDFEVVTASGDVTPPAEPDDNADPSTAEDVPTDAEDAGADPDEPKKPKGVQKRIDELTRQAREAERDREYWREMAMRPGQQPAAQQPQQQAPQPVQLTPDLAQYVGQPPNPDTFPAGEFDPAYMMARIKYDSRQEQASQVAAQRQQQSQRVQIESYQSYQGRLDDARTRYADFDAVAGDPSVPIRTDVALVIAQSEHGPDIAYYLGKNRAEAARIAGLTPVMAAREIGRIEARFDAKPAPSAAPSPASTTLRGNGSTATRNVENMSMSEYRAARESGRLK